VKYRDLATTPPDRTWVQDGSVVEWWECMNPDPSKIKVHVLTSRGIRAMYELNKRRLLKNR